MVNPVSAWSEKRTLQTCVALAGLVAVWAGAWGVLHDLGGHGGGLASHERYLSGLLLAIGLAFWTTVSDIERKTARFRLLTALVVIGGASRLLGVALGDTLSWSIGGALAMELLVAPLLCLGRAASGRHRAGQRVAALNEVSLYSARCARVPDARSGLSDRVGRVAVTGR
jgi:Domain of unknown function (DUF4345)